MAPRRSTYIRFVVGSDGDHHRKLTGIVTEVRFLRDDDELSTHERAQLEATYEWFNDHVRVPPFSDGRWPQDVVCWFKDDARKAISRMWDLVAILRAHDMPTRMLRAVNPGRVVYEDDLQVVVEEWNRL
jgi:hypothetical protein